MEEWEEIHGERQAALEYDSLGELRMYRDRGQRGQPAHWHRELEVVFQTEGSSRLSLGERQEVLEEGDLLFLNSCVLHAVELESGERRVLHLDDRLLMTLDDMETMFLRLPSYLIFRRDSREPLSCRLHQRMRDIVAELDAGGVFCEAAVYASLMGIFIRIGRDILYPEPENAAVRTSQWQEYRSAVLHTCAYINEHYQEKLTLEHVAAVCGFSKFHFTRVFRQIMGMTFYDYLNARRIRRACELLGKLNMSVTEAAMSSGFSSLSAFNRTFRSAQRCSPSEFRKKMWSASYCSLREQ